MEATVSPNTQSYCQMSNEHGVLLMPASPRADAGGGEGVARAGFRGRSGDARWSPVFRGAYQSRQNCENPNEDYYYYYYYYYYDYYDYYRPAFT